MNGRLQEDVAWTMLLDMQREIENATLYGGGVSLGRTVAQLAGRAWLLAGLAARRAPRRRPVPAGRIA